MLCPFTFCQDKKKLLYLFVSLIFIFISILSISEVTFQVLKWYFEKYQVSATTSAYRIELPQEISKKDLPNLTREQNEQIEKHVGEILQVKIQAVREVREVVRPMVVILTENNRPILPESGKTQPPEVGGQAPSVTPTVALLTPTTSLSITPCGNGNVYPNTYPNTYSDTHFDTHSDIKSNANTNANNSAYRRMY